MVPNADIISIRNINKTMCKQTRDKLVIQCERKLYGSHKQNKRQSVFILLLKSLLDSRFLCLVLNALDISNWEYNCLKKGTLLKK